MPLTRALTLRATALIVAATALPVQAQEGETRSALRDLTPDQLVRAVTRAERESWSTARVQDFAFEHDAARFRFDSGIVGLLEVEGEVVGAVFDGEGTFRMASPDPLEAWQIERVFDTPEVRLEVERAYFLFDERTAAELQAQLDFQDASPQDRSLRAFEDHIEDAAKFIGINTTTGREAVRTFVNGEGDDFLHVHLKAKDGGPYFFRYSTFDAEEITFGRKGSGRGDFYETLNSFHSAGEYPDPDRTMEVPGSAGFLHYEIQAEIASSVRFSAESKTFFTTTLEAGDWVPIYLFSELEVDSLRWSGGADEVWERAGSYLWVQLPENADLQQMTIGYHGDLLEYREFFYLFRSPTGWYPQIGRTDATFDMTFRVADRYAFLGSGTRTEHHEGEDWNTSRWVMDRPESQASFNLGDYEEHVFENPGVPPIRLQVNEDFHRRLLGASIFLQEKNVAEAVGADLASALSFFQDVYGPLEVDAFNASEIPYNHGQAFPSLIHLSVMTFLQTGNNDSGQNEAFRAHEVAHQWWGLSVEPRSDRDRWLAEGLSEFSGLWYMQVARFNPDSYFKALEESRERIFDRREQAGPISLGSRAGIGRRGGEDYVTQIYDKGAWVIHMLRNLFMDMDTMDEQAFKGLMKQTAEGFKNRRITTEEFTAVVEQYIGADMQWFFDQWVHGTELPTYRWATRGEEVPEGYRVTLRVRQEDVSPEFKMVVPVTLDFGVEGSATVKIMVEGPETVVELPLLPREPDDIVFNDFHSVLAEVKKEGW